MEPKTVVASLFLSAFFLLSSSKTEASAATVIDYQLITKTQHFLIDANTSKVQYSKIQGPFVDWSPCQFDINNTDYQECNPYSEPYYINDSRDYSISGSFDAVYQEHVWRYIRWPTAPEERRTEKYMYFTNWTVTRLGDAQEFSLPTYTIKISGNTFEGDTYPCSNYLCPPDMHCSCSGWYMGPMPSLQGSFEGTTVIINGSDPISNNDFSVTEQYYYEIVATAVPIPPTGFLFLSSLVGIVLIKRPKAVC